MTKTFPLHIPVLFEHAMKILCQHPRQVNDCHHDENDC